MRGARNTVPCPAGILPRARPLQFLRQAARSLATLLFILAATGSRLAAAETNGTAVIHAVHDSSATTAFDPDPVVIRRMVDRGIRALGRSDNLTNAWRRFIKPDDVVGFRVISSPGPVSGTRPVVVSALAESLLSIGHPPRQVVIWDRRASDLILAGYARIAERLGIRWVATEEAGWDERHFYENAALGRLLVGDLEFPKRFQNGVGRKSFVSNLLTRDVTRIIPVTPLLNHYQTGVSGQLVGLSLGAVDNTMRFEQDAHVMAEVLPEICALDEIFGKLAFGITDALVCQYRGEERTLLHYAVTLNELRFSTDPVALDAQALADIQSSRNANPTEGERPFKSELYRNAAILEVGVADMARIEVKRSPAP